MPEIISPDQQEDKDITPETPFIAFEGINRVGKGTQIENLEEAISELGMDSVVLRGDGTRGGTGETEGDPFDLWWQEHSQQLRAEGTTEEWNKAAYMLALELKDWREKAAELGKQVALIDRSVLSRASFVIDREASPSTDILLIDDLYPIQPDQKITLEDILPDVIFELSAPKDVILSRLDTNDPKYQFRSNLIDQCYDTFYQAKNRLPANARERIITIDSSQPPHMVFDDILESLNTRVESWKKLRSRGE